MTIIRICNGFAALKTLNPKLSPPAKATVFSFYADDSRHTTTHTHALSRRRHDGE
jgi:hypothetical protein